MKLFNNMFWD